MCISVLCVLAFGGQGQGQRQCTEHPQERQHIVAFVGALLCQMKDTAIAITFCTAAAAAVGLPQVDKAFRREFSSRAELWGDAQAVYRDRGPHLDGPGWRAAGASLPPRTPLELLGKSPEVGAEWRVGQTMGYARVLTA